MGSRHSVSSSASFGTCSDVTSMKQVVSVYNEITADKYEARLLRAVRRKDYRVCQYLARKRDVDLNVVEFGHSALNIAIHQRDTEIVKLLLDAGRLAKMVDWNGLPACFIENISVSAMLRL